MNPYNPQLLAAWGANMDIQFVLDTYACAKYCVSYMLKSDGGASKLLRQVNQQAASGNEQQFQNLEKCAKILWTGTEISSQEAAGYLMSIKNVDSSRADIFINTSPPEDRTYILKPKEELEALDDDEEDVVAKGILDRYANRADELEDTCLADYAAQYEYKKKATKKKKQTDDSDDDKDIDQDNEVDDGDNDHPKSNILFTNSKFTSFFVQTNIFLSF